MARHKVTALYSSSYWYERSKSKLMWWLTPLLILVVGSEFFGGYPNPENSGNKIYPVPQPTTMPSTSKCTWCDQQGKICTVPKDSSKGKCSVCIERRKPCSLSNSGTNPSKAKRASEAPSEPILNDEKSSTPEVCKIEVNEVNKLSYLEKAKLKRKRKASEAGERSELRELQDKFKRMEGEFEKLEQLVYSLKEGVDIFLNSSSHVICNQDPNATSGEDVHDSHFG